jgi:hypothetical protein
MKPNDSYIGFDVYNSQPITESPLIEQIDTATLISWFRCNSCLSCKFRKEVLEKDTSNIHDIHWCARMHKKENIIDMVSCFGYSKEGREHDITPRFERRE